MSDKTQYMKTTIAAVIFALLLIIVAFIVSSSGNNGASGITGGVNGTGETDSNASNVTVVDGKQIIEIDVRGGYNPSKSIAKAGIPTSIRFKTRGTFDCSSSIRIASLNVNQILPQTGSTDIDVGSQAAGILNGTCGMGMYRFEVDFN